MKTIFPNTYLVFDTETSGLDPNKDKIIEFAAIGVKDGEVVEEYQALLSWKGVEINPLAFDAHGIDNEMLKQEGKNPVEVLSDIADMFLRYNCLVGHNSLRFDNLFIDSHFEDFKAAPLIQPDWKTIDTAAIYKGITLSIPREWNETLLEYQLRVLDTRVYGFKYNIKECCDRLGIDMTGIQQHRAMGDVLLTHEIYKKLCLDH